MGWSEFASRSNAGSNAEWRSRIESLTNLYDVDSEILEIIEKVENGERLSRQDALSLYQRCDGPTLSMLANSVKVSRFGQRVFFNRNLHINQTNICTLACRFCAFRRSKSAPDAYQLSKTEYLDRLRQFDGLITEVHTVGGLHPEWDITFYEDLFQSVKAEFPYISIKALSAVEIKHLSARSDISIESVLRRLKGAGLDSLPGGGAEILDDGVRDVICRGKESSSDYLDIHRTAHKLGIPSNCTMLFGTIESDELRIEHLCKLRQLQDETGGFQCFVPYPFLADNSRLPEARLASSEEVLKTIAISRLMLDNIPHIKAYRMNIGDQIASLALLSGADDIDGTVSHEEIMHSAGSVTSLDDFDEQLAILIESVGCFAVERNTDYTKFRSFRRERHGSGGSDPSTAVRQEV